MANDYFKAQGWFKNYATSSEDSRGVFQELVKEDEEAFKMAKAKVQRFEMDNFNTPDLDQGADSILRPGETLEDFDVTFRRPNAQGGRQGFDKGLSAKQKKALTITYPKSNKDLEIKKTSTNIKTQQAANNYLYDLYGKDVVDNAAKEWAKKSNLEKNRTRKIENTDLPLDQMKHEDDRRNFRKKFKEDIIEYGEWNPDRKSSAATKRYADHVKRAKTGTFETIIFDAFGRKNLKGTKTPNPGYDLTKLDAIHKNIDEYKILKEYLKTNFGIVTELDHPLDKNTIRSLMNSNASDLTNVNILEKNLNDGFKKQLNNKYFQAVQSGNLDQKRAVEKIAKQFNFNIGSVPDKQFVKNQVGPFEFNKIDKGVGSFETLNIKDEMLKSLDNAAELNTTWGKYVKENPGIFKDAGFDLKTLKKPKNVENIANNIEDIRAYIKKIDPVLAKKVDITLNSGIPVDQMLKEIRKIPGVNKLGKGFMKVGGPFEVAFLGFDTVNELSKGKDFDESFKTAVQNLTFGAYKGGDREKLETLSDAATELNLDNTGFAEIRKTMELTKKIESVKKVKMGELASNDQSLTNMTDQEVEAFYDKQINKLQTEINDIGTSLKESGNFDTLVNNYTKVTKYVAGKQYDKGLEGNILTGNRRDRVFPGQGDIGSGVSSTISDFRSFLPQNFLQNSITKAIPNTLRKLPFGVGSIFEPTSSRAKLFDSSKEEKDERLKKMEQNIKGEIEQNYYSEGGITQLRSNYEYKK